MVAKDFKGFKTVVTTVYLNFWIFKCTLLNLFEHMHCLIYDTTSMYFKKLEFIVYI
jgi:hypothetical protein